MTVDDEFTAFVTARGGRMLHAADLLVGNRQAAEDLLQAALVKTYLAWGRIEEPDAYTRTILARLSVDRWRSRRWREVSTDVLPEVTAASDPAGDLARRDEVQRALAVLTRRERAVVVLRFWEDLTEAQIAEALRIAPGTVKSTAARALGRLRSCGLLTLNAEVDDHA